jgi:sulfur carrier protein
VNVLVNGEPKELEAGATVQSALAALALEGGERGVAVAVDAEVVPRGEWPRRELSDGARLEVLRAIQGG